MATSGQRALTTKTEALMPWNVGCHLQSKLERADLASLSPSVQAPAAMATIEGQVVWRRRFNAVFHFFDLLRTAGRDGDGHDGGGHDDGGTHDGGAHGGGERNGGGHDGGDASARVRLLVSSGHMPKELAKEAGKAVRCGDVVRVTCDLDAEKQLWRVTALQVLS